MDASASTALLKPMASPDSRVGQMLGRMWTKMMRMLWTPMSRADRTKSRSRYLRNSPRTSRAKLGMNSTPSAPMTLYFPGPVRASTTRASSTLGKAATASHSRMMSASAGPP